MTAARLKGNHADFSVCLRTEDYEALLLHEEPGRNFRQLAQDIIREFLAQSPRVQAARAESDDRRADRAFADIESAMSIFQTEKQIPSDIV